MTCYHSYLRVFDMLSGARTILKVTSESCSNSIDICLRDFGLVLNNISLNTLTYFKNALESYKNLKAPLETIAFLKHNWRQYMSNNLIGPLTTAVKLSQSTDRGKLWFNPLMLIATKRSLTNLIKSSSHKRI